jgi:dTDP-4-amino-4,6-dideoxygalactose transaminase
MGLVNMDNLDLVIEHNKSNYRAYRQGLERLPGISVFTLDEAEKNNYQYVVMEVDESCPVSRNDIVEALHAENILARKYFWPGCHNMLPYRKLYPHARLLLPVTEQISDKVVVLPTGTAVSAEIVNVIRQVVETVVRGKS